jgi:hypothetical protein
MFLFQRLIARVKFRSGLYRTDLYGIYSHNVKPGIDN